MVNGLAVDVADTPEPQAHVGTSHRRWRTAPSIRMRTRRLRPAPGSVGRPPARPGC
ncbi:MAG: hypothetical protein MZV64_70735 [Ignavibacteriales bacterium]|nr:hypothetical protein [Ignavibacteriales bacterium]